MDNTTRGTLERKFVCLDNVSKFLYCSICDDIFMNPIRLKSCGHTYCLNCILSWGRRSLQCPLCRIEFKDDDIVIDIIATNIINDLEVFCVNSGCPWKGKLKELNNHNKICYFNPNEIPDYIKEILNDKKDIKKIGNNENTINIKQGDSEEVNDNNLTSFNTKSSLKARLYNRNRELFNNIFLKGKKVGTDEKEIIHNKSELLSILKDNNIVI